MFLIISLFSFSTAHQTAFALHNKKDSSELDFRTAEPTLSKCYFSILEAYRQKQPPEVFYENVFPTNFSKFTGKHLCQSLFFKRFYYRFFPVNFPTTLFTKHRWGTASAFRTMSNIYDRTFLWK